ncbi:Histidinol dehydrogenase, partial [Salmonella enterica subsp. enterica serovar Gaminara str. A4-567]
FSRPDKAEPCDGVKTMSFNTLIDWNSCSPEQQRALRALLTRPAITSVRC